MRESLLFITLISLFSATFAACSPKKVVVEEWTKGFPSNQALTETEEQDQSTFFAKYSVAQIGASKYSVGEDRIVTVDQSGDETRSVVQTDGKTSRYFNYDSFEPVLLKVSPEAKDNIDSAENYKMWSSISLSAGTALIGFGSIVAGPYMIPAYSIFSLCLSAGAKFDSLAKNEYIEAKKKYVTALNDMSFGKWIKSKQIAASQN